MYPIEWIDGIRLITGTCFQIRGGERVIIVAYGDEEVKVASLLAADMKAAHAEVAIVIVEPPRAIEPPPFLAEAMKKVDICISLGEIDYGHTRARKDAFPLQYAYLPPVMYRSLRMSTVCAEDLLEIENRTEWLAEAVSRAKQVHVTSQAGTDLVVDIEGRKGFPIHPVFRKSGHFAIIPYYAEVACAPIEGKTAGTYVANGSVWGDASIERIVSEPIIWRVENGKVVSMTGGRDAQDIREALSKFDQNALSIGELGIGMNHKLSNRLTGTKLDDAIFGTVHLALGRNISIGGNQWSSVHIDFLSMDIRLELDGKVYIEKGHLLR